MQEYFKMIESMRQLSDIARGPTSIATQFAEQARRLQASTSMADQFSKLARTLRPEAVELTNSVSALLRQVQQTTFSDAASRDLFKAARLLAEATPTPSARLVRDLNAAVRRLAFYELVGPSLQITALDSVIRSRSLLVDFAVRANALGAFSSLASQIAELLPPTSSDEGKEQGLTSLEQVVHAVAARVEEVLRALPRGATLPNIANVASLLGFVLAIYSVLLAYQEPRFVNGLRRDMSSLAAENAELQTRVDNLAALVTSDDASPVPPEDERMQRIMASTESSRDNLLGALAPMIRVTTVRARVHGAPRANSELRAVLEPGVSVIFLERHHRWIRISFTGIDGTIKEGWVRSRSLASIE